MFGIYYERKITLELWQLYDSVGNETGKIIEANSEIPEGLYHKTVSVWIKNKKEQYLMSKRSPEKQYAYCWECTGGSVQAGENTWEAACREVYEELGIDISSLTGKKLISKKRKEQKDFYRKMKQLYALPDNRTEEEKEQDFISSLSEGL